MAVLGGGDCSNDDVGRQKASCIQKGVWEGVPTPKEGYDTIFILNLWGTCALLWHNQGVLAVPRTPSEPGTFMLLRNGGWFSTIPLQGRGFHDCPLRYCTSRAG